MTNLEARFTFPASLYYQKSNSFKNRVNNFVDEMENSFFRVVTLKASFLDYSDRVYVLEPNDDGLKKMADLKDNYLKKLSDMRNENSKNPMDALVQCDEKYSRTFKRYLDGKQTQEINKKMNALEVKVGEAVFKEYQNLSKEELETAFSDVADTLKTVFGSDWYARFAQMAGVADFIRNFEEKVDQFAKHHPKKADTLFKVMEQSDEFTNFLRGIERQSSRLKQNKYSSKVLDKIGKTSKWLDRLKQLGTGRFLGFAEKFLGAGVKAGWVGAVTSVGLSAYYNAKDKEIAKNFSEGKAIRGSTKVVAGTVIDTVEKFGVVDGLVGGFLVGGPKVAIMGGALGALNKAVQFIAPSGYKKLKALAFKAIDWTADMGVKAWKGIKSVASNVWSNVKSIGRSIGNGISKGYKTVKSVTKNAASKAKRFGKSVGTGLKIGYSVAKSTTKEAVSKVKSTGEAIGDAVRSGFNSFKSGIASFVN